MYWMLMTGLLAGLFVWIAAFVFYFRRQLNAMSGMTAAMAVGMSVGLGMGSLLAMRLPDGLVLPALPGMLIGGAAGLFIGWPISLLAVMDGLLSGAMGGMMGGMLPMMIPEAGMEMAEKLMAVFSSGALFLLFIVLQTEIKPELLRKKPFMPFMLFRPVSMFSLICLVFGLALFM